MQIHGLGTVHGPQQLKAPHGPQPTQPGSASAGDNINIDRLEISPEADAISRAREASDVRLDRVNEIRQQIADGTYETEEKLNLALDRLLDELA